MTGTEPTAILDAELRSRLEGLPPSLARATWQLVLGELEASLETLRSVHRDMADQAEPAGRPEAIALLVGDRKSATRHATAALQKGRERWAPGWRQYQGSMLALLAGDDGPAGQQIAELEMYASGHARLPSGPSSDVLDIPAGILAADAARASSGVDRFLDWHLRSARSRSNLFNSPAGVVCLEAVVALLVAHDRGITLQVDPKYRQASVPVLVVSLLEWEGRPLDRARQLSLETDLVAGPWLAARGLDLGQLPPPGLRSGPRSMPQRSAGPGDLDAAAGVDALRRRVADGQGSRWQLVSWALAAGDDTEARHHLQLAVAEARQVWAGHDSPHHNLVREHFGLSLAVRDEPGIAEAGAMLRTWMDAVMADERRQGRTLQPAYAHASGYLDFIVDLLGPTSPRAPADQVSAVPRHLYAACIGFERRDAGLVEQGMHTTLDTHAQELERNTSPPAPLCLPAMQLAEAARRLGMEVPVDPRWSAHAVPIRLRPEPGSPDRMVRLPIDLLGRVLLDGPR
jgi:hypothetical protein